MMQRIRGARSYWRREPSLEPYDTVLIVCEGEKTEPGYLRAARQAYRLSSVNINIIQSPGSDPMTIINYADSELIRNGYDRAFCVFDEIGHANFTAAMNKMGQLDSYKHGKLRPIISCPCFEIWVLLHYIYTTRSFVGTGKSLPCESVIRELKKTYPTYAKNNPTMFSDLEDKLDDALNNAARLHKYNVSSGSRNPSTEMHNLMTYLKELGPDV